MRPEEEKGDRLRRLHPSSLVFRLGSAVLRLVVPGLLVVLFASGDSAEIWLMVLFLPWTIYELLHYATVRYRFGMGELVIREGVFTRNERHVPFARIQNIDLIQNPLHRLLGVAEVRLETAGGSDPEAVFRVLSSDAVEVMRRRIFAERKGAAGAAADLEWETAPAAPVSADSAPATGPPSAEEERLLLRLGTGDLVRLGMISNRGLAMVAAALGLSWQFDLLERLQDSLAGWLKSVPLDGSTWQSLALWVAGGTAVAVLGLLLLSIAWTIVRLHGFELRRSGDDLRLRCGLLTRRSATVPRHRIQLLAIHESPLHRLLHRVTVRVETAGGLEGRDADSTLGRSWFLPLVRPGDLPALLEEVLPSVDLPAAAWRPLAPRALRRRVARAVLHSLVLTALAGAILQGWAVLAWPLVLALLLVATFRDQAFSRFAVLESGLAWRSGAFTRKISVVPFRRVQVVSLRESPFDRRHGMRTLAVDSAGSGPAGHRVAIPFLPGDEARQLFDHLRAEVERSALHW